MFKVWSDQEQSWWLPDYAGFTTVEASAGTYTQDECDNTSKYAGMRKAGLRFVPAQETSLAA